MRFVSISIRTAAEGLKAEITMSPSLVDELAREGLVLLRDDEAELLFDAPVLDATDERDIRYRLAQIEISPGVEEIERSGNAPDFDA